MVTQVRDRSLGLFPGFADVSQILVTYYVTRVGKGLNLNYGLLSCLRVAVPTRLLGTG